MKSARLSDSIADRLEIMIGTGGLKPGDRLPAERQLAHELGVSRTSLREAIQQLSSRGRLVTRTGGGTFVQEQPAGWSREVIVDPLTRLLRGDPEYRFDVLEIRHALEGAAAWHATLRATEEDRQRIRQCFEAMLERHGSEDPMEEARADAAFHVSIAEASHNLVLIHIMRSLFDLLQANISQNLEKLYTIPRVFERLSEQHRELMEAILAGDPARARDAAHMHLDFVQSSLKTIDEDEARKARSFRLPVTKA